MIARIDELGRVLIPKEMRKSCGIIEGDPIEIKCVSEGVLLKRYSPLENLSKYAKSVSTALSSACECVVLVVTLNRIIATSKNKALLSTPISISLENFLREKKGIVANRGDEMVRIINEKLEYFSQIILPLTLNGDVVGGIVMLNTDDKKVFDLNDMKIVKAFSVFIEKQVK